MDIPEPRLTRAHIYTKPDGNYYIMDTNGAERLLTADELKTLDVLSDEEMQILEDYLTQPKLDEADE